jgi:hypothetical protein
MRRGRRFLSKAEPAALQVGDDLLGEQARIGFVADAEHPPAPRAEAQPQHEN